VIRLDDARMCELHQRVKLSFEQLDASNRVVRAAIDSEDLQRNDVARDVVPSAVYGRHSATPEQLQDLVALREPEGGLRRIRGEAVFTHPRSGYAPNARWHSPVSASPRGERRLVSDKVGHGPAGALPDGGRSPRSEIAVPVRSISAAGRKAAHR